ncbi:MAG: MFS transporter [Inhella sp.]
MSTDGLRYGLLGLPLAFLALPLYVSLPAYYAREHGLALASLGALLLGARAADALLDPLIGRLSDGWLRPGRVRPVLGAAALLMLLAFAALFFPPPLSGNALLAWAGLMLVVAYLGFSVLSISHQAWGARLGGNAQAQTRIHAWREGFALLGVLLASVLISTAGWGATTAALALLLLAGLLALFGSPLPAPVLAAQPLRWSLPWRTPGFRRLLLVYAVNGIAAAVPATVLLFFVRDRLQAPQWEAGFLVAYFAAAALALPLWLRAVGRLGQARSWLLAMGLAVLSFVWAASLGAGDGMPFLVICLASGAAAGADLAIPPAMLARVVQQTGLGGRAEGAFFGWWTAASKLNLALAAGLALPLLQALGYRDGARDAEALQALSWVYALLPCVLKLIAMALLWALWLRPGPSAFALESTR